MNGVSSSALKIAGPMLLRTERPRRVDRAIPKIVRDGPAPMPPGQDDTDPQEAHQEHGQTTAQRPPPATL